MQETIDFLIRHGGLLIFATVLLDEMGFPMPAVPFLLAAGALAAKHQLSAGTAIGLGLLACFIADTTWFYLGRRGGNKVLHLICRISLEPDSCIRRTRNIFDRYGMRAVLVAKFLPGLSAIVPPMAGNSGVPFWRYLAFDFVGSSLYLGSYLMLGALFSNQLESLLEALAGLGRSAFVLLLGLALAYIGFKYFQRRRLLHELHLTRITVDELRQKQQQGEKLAIVDLRAKSELEKDPVMVFGALHRSMDEIDRWSADLPQDCEIIVYCSCPNEVSAARVAWELKRKGLARVRPLQGGIAAWRERNYPLGSYAEHFSSTR